MNNLSWIDKGEQKKLEDKEIVLKDGEITIIEGFERLDYKSNINVNYCEIYPNFGMKFFIKKDNIKKHVLTVKAKKMIFTNVWMPEKEHIAIKYANSEEDIDNLFKASTLYLVFYDKEDVSEDEKEYFYNQKPIEKDMLVFRNDLTTLKDEFGHEHDDVDSQIIRNVYFNKYHIQNSDLEKFESMIKSLTESLAWKVVEIIEDIALVEKNGKKAFIAIDCLENLHNAEESAKFLMKMMEKRL